MLRLKESLSPTPMSFLIQDSKNPFPRPPPVKTLARWTRSLLSLSSPQSGFPEIPRLQVRTCWSYLPSTGKKRLQRRWPPYWTRSCRLAYLRRGASSGVRRSRQSRWAPDCSRILMNAELETQGSLDTDPFKKFLVDSNVNSVKSWNIWVAGYEPRQALS